MVPTQPSTRSQTLRPPCRKRASKVVYADDHSRPDGVHSWPEARANDVSLKHNIPMQWKQRAERLQRLPPHAAVPAHRWRVFLNDVGHFLRGHWAERAAGLGWDAECLFACHPGRPLDHLQGAGLLWRIGGGKIVGMYSDWAVLEINGERQAVHRRPTPANFVLPCIS